MPDEQAKQQLDGPWLDDREAQAWRNFIAACGHLTARLNRQLLLDTKLSGADYEVLVNLSEAQDHRLRSFELVELMDWEKSRLSHQLTRMERRGLVRRVNCPSDGRGAFIVLTDDGLAAIETAAPLHVAEVRRSFIGALTTEQLDTLGEITGLLLAHFSRLDSADDPPALPKGGARPDDD